MTQPGGGDRQAQVVDEGRVRPRSAGERHQAVRLAVDFVPGLADQGDERIIGVDAGRGLAAQVGNLHICEAFGVQVAAQLVENVLGLLIGDETKIYFGRGPRRLDGLRAGALVAGGQAANRTGGAENFFDAQFDPPRGDL